MAKTLYLMRHAKAAAPDMQHSDLDRALNERGLHDATEMGQRLQNLGVKPEVILCSPAKRTRQTAERLMKELGGTMDIVQFDDRIYEASTDTLLDLIRLLPEACASAMVIGHNPSIGWLANQLSRYQIETMPSCAVATFELPSFSWRDLGRTPSRLLEFDHPMKVR